MKYGLYALPLLYYAVPQKGDILPFWSSFTTNISSVMTSQIIVLDGTRDR